MNEFVRRLCALEDVPDGGSRGALRDGYDDRVFVVRRGASVQVWLNDCPHEHRPLAFRQDRYLSADGGHIVCYAHSAHFDLDTGRCYGGPCVGQSLVPVPARVRDGAVWVAEDLPSIFG